MTAKIEPNKVSSPRRKWLLLFDCGLDSELSRLPPTTAAAVAEVPRAISEKPEDIPNSEAAGALQTSNRRPSSATVGRDREKCDTLGQRRRSSATLERPSTAHPVLQSGRRGRPPSGIEWRPQLGPGRSWPPRGIPPNPAHQLIAGEMRPRPRGPPCYPPCWPGVRPRGATLPGRTWGRSPLPRAMMGPSGPFFYRGMPPRSRFEIAGHGPIAPRPGMGRIPRVFIRGRQGRGQGFGGRILLNPRGGFMARGRGRPPRSSMMVGPRTGGRAGVSFNPDMPTSSPTWMVSTVNNDEANYSAQPAIVSTPTPTLNYEAAPFAEDLALRNTTQKAVVAMPSMLSWAKPFKANTEEHGSSGKRDTAAGQEKNMFREGMPRQGLKASPTAATQIKTAGDAKILSLPPHQDGIQGWLQSEANETSAVLEGVAAEKDNGGDSERAEGPLSPQTAAAAMSVDKASSALGRASEADSLLVYLKGATAVGDIAKQKGGGGGMPAPAVEPVETNSGGGEGRGRGEGGEEGGLSLLAQAVGLSTTVTKVTEGSTDFEDGSDRLQQVIGRGDGVAVSRNRTSKGITRGPMVKPNLDPLSCMTKMKGQSPIDFKDEADKEPNEQAKAEAVPGGWPQMGTIDAPNAVEEEYALKGAKTASALQSALSSFEDDSGPAGDTISSALIAQRARVEGSLLPRAVSPSSPSTKECYHRPSFARGSPACVSHETKGMIPSDGVIENGPDLGRVVLAPPDKVYQSRRLSLSGGMPSSAPSSPTTSAPQANPGEESQAALEDTKIFGTTPVLPDWSATAVGGTAGQINPTSPRGGAHDSRTDNNRAEDADRTLDWPTQVVAEAASRKKPSSLSRTNSPGGEVLPAALSGISIPAAKQAATFGIAPDNISSGNKVEGVSGVNWLSTAAESRIKPEGAPIASDVTAEATSHASNNKSSGLGGWLNAATTSGRLVLSTDGNGGGNCTATQSENERRTQTKKGSKYAATLPPPTSGSWLTAALTSGLLGVSCGENDGDVGTSREQPRFGVSEIATQTNELAVTEIKAPSASRPKSTAITAQEAPPSDWPAATASGAHVKKSSPSTFCHHKSFPDKDTCQHNLGGALRAGNLDFSVDNTNSDATYFPENAGTGGGASTKISSAKDKTSIEGASSKPAQRGYSGRPAMIVSSGRLDAPGDDKYGDGEASSSEIRALTTGITIETQTEENITEAAVESIKPKPKLSPCANPWSPPAPDIDHDPPSTNSTLLGDKGSKGTVGRLGWINDAVGGKPTRILGTPMGGDENSLEQGVGGCARVVETASTGTQWEETREEADLVSSKSIISPCAKQFASSPTKETVVNLAPSSTNEVQGNVEEIQRRNDKAKPDTTSPSPLAVECVEALKGVDSTYSSADVVVNSSVQIPGADERLEIRTGEIRAMKLDGNYGRGEKVVETTFPMAPTAKKGDLLARACDTVGVANMIEEAEVLQKDGASVALKPSSPLPQEYFIPNRPSQVGKPPPRAPGNTQLGPPSSPKRRPVVNERLPIISSPIAVAAAAAAEVGIPKSQAGGGKGERYLTSLAPLDISRANEPWADLRCSTPFRVPHSLGSAEEVAGSSTVVGARTIERCGEGASYTKGGARMALSAGQCRKTMTHIVISMDLRVSAKKKSIRVNLDRGGTTVETSMVGGGTVSSQDNIHTLKRKTRHQDKSTSTPNWETVEMLLP